MTKALFEADKSIMRKASLSSLKPRLKDWAISTFIRERLNTSKKRDRKS
ncbi:hypothetical protein PO124_34725 [Bacillus licheniformis]|nr:hypothetical protein [Bacillus licheniformis]